MLRYPDLQEPVVDSGFLDDSSVLDWVSKVVYSY